MSDRLTAEPGTLEFLRQLLEIAQESDHPMDKALTKVLSKQIRETEAAEVGKAANISRMGNAHYVD
jgi:hypothetical protein